jgi:membrane associated rhomboid family serine protease
MAFDLEKLKRAFRLQYPPEHPYHAGPTLGSRPFEALPEITPVVTYTYILLSAVLFYFTSVQTGGNSFEVHQALNRLGHRDDLNILYRDWWALATNALFHADYIHIIMNSLWILSLGKLLERGLGSVKTFFLLLTFSVVSGGYQILAGTWFFFVNDFKPEQVYLVLPHLSSSLGLSGIVYGIIGFMWGSWKRWTGFLIYFNNRLLSFMLIWQVICFILTYSGTMQIANTAHISGLIIGFLIGMCMCYGIRQSKPYFFLTVTMLALLVTGLVYNHIQISKLVEPNEQELENNRWLVTDPLFQ